MHHRCAPTSSCRSGSVPGRQPALYPVGKEHHHADREDKTSETLLLASISSESSFTSVAMGQQVAMSSRALCGAPLGSSRLEAGRLNHERKPEVSISYRKFVAASSDNGKLCRVECLFEVPVHGGRSGLRYPMSAIQRIGLSSPRMHSGLLLVFLEFLRDLSGGGLIGQTPQPSTGHVRRLGGSQPDSGFRPRRCSSRRSPRR